MSEHALTVTRHLPVKLDEKRKLELLDELSEHITVFNQLEKLKKDQADSTGRAMQRHKAEMAVISQTVAQGLEMKPIPCHKVIDFVEGKYTVVRLDTNEVIEDRPLTEQDMAKG